VERTVVKARKPVSGASIGGPSAVRAAVGVVLVDTMSRVYRLRTVLSWDRRLTLVRFFLTPAVLGALATGFILSLTSAGDVLRALASGGVLAVAGVVAGVERSVRRSTAAMCGTISDGLASRCSGSVDPTASAQLK